MTPAATDRALLTVAGAGLGAGLLAVVVLATAAGAVEVLWGLSAALALALAVALARPSPLARLGGVLALQVLQLQGGRGTDLGEVVAGLAIVAYLGHWYLLAVLSGRPLVRTLSDAAAVAWGTVGFAAAAALGLVFGPDAYDFRADVLATIPFLFYLPVKEACAETDRGAVVVGGVLCLLGVVATLANVAALRGALSSADALYQIADARFNTGETSITAGLMVALATAALTRRRALALAAVAVAGLLLAGLIITKSRGFWISAAFGIAAMAVVAPGQGRRRILGYGALGVVSLVGLAVVVAGDQLLLVALGALDRLVSVGTAGNDISLLNRVAESEAVWARIRQNPVLGHGLGVQVSHYSLISGGTRSWAFFHNGYLALWFKTGLWGLALMLTVWVGAMARAARAARLPSLPPRTRALALGAGATVAAFTPVAITSNPFALLDQMLVVTLVLALAHGVADRADARRRGAGS